MTLEELGDNIQNWITEEYSSEVQKWITEEYSPLLQEWIENYVTEKINKALLNIHEDTKQHDDIVDCKKYNKCEWKVYRIKEIGQRLDDSGLTPKWHSYAYLYPEVYLTKEAAQKHQPNNLHCDTAHSTYEIIEQTVIDK